LPNISDFFDHVEIKVGNQQFIFIFLCSSKDLSAWIHKIRGAIKLSQVPGLFFTHPIDTAHEVTVGHGMSRLLQLPQVL
jgi:hypothetical protein